MSMAASRPSEGMVDLNIKHGSESYYEHAIVDSVRVAGSRPGIRP